MEPAKHITAIARNAIINFDGLTANLKVWKIFGKRRLSKKFGDFSSLPIFCPFQKGFSRQAGINIFIRHRYRCIYILYYWVVSIDFIIFLSHVLLMLVRSGI